MSKLDEIKNRLKAHDLDTMVEFRSNAPTDIKYLLELVKRQERAIDVLKLSLLGDEEYRTKTNKVVDQILSGGQSE